MNDDGIQSFCLEVGGLTGSVLIKCSVCYWYWSSGGTPNLGYLVQQARSHREVCKPAEKAR